MKVTRLAQVLSVVILFLATGQLFAATYIVGTCKAGKQFATIGAALDAVSAPNTTVLICPGFYPEQVWITKSVNLRGLIADNSSQVTIGSPSVGLQGNDVDNDGNIIAAQIRVTDTTGPVNISDITVDGINSNGGSINFPYDVVGVFYRNSSGTVNRVITQNQGATVLNAFGIWIEGGTSNPSVTVENSSIHNFRLIGGIVSGQPFASSQPAPLSATIKNNFLSVDFPQEFTKNIYLTSCDTCTTTVTGNTVVGGVYGIFMHSGTGPVTANKLMNNYSGIGIDGGSYAATSNGVLGSTGSGIAFFAPNSSLFEHNTVVGSPIGIDFSCHADDNVGSNLIEDVGIGLNKVPSGISPTNTHANIGTIKTGC